MTIKVSYIVPVLNSHEIVLRQIWHLDRIGLFEMPGVEFILVDDGSDPPHRLPEEGSVPNMLIHYTHDTRPWTWALARNAGARLARGDYLLMTDLDYIIPRKAFDACLWFTGDKLRFKREFGVLNENGVFTQDLATLNAYGLPWERIQNKGVRMPPHPNNFCIRKKLYWEMGGYREDLIHRPYPQGEDRWFKRKWIEFCRTGRAKESDHDDRPTIYMFPNGQFCGDVDHNPMNLFHDLSRKTILNRHYTKSSRRE